MITENIILEVLRNATDLAQKADNLNRRLINALIICIVVFGLTICTITACYFLVDYQYPATTQEVTKDSVIQKTN